MVDLEERLADLGLSNVEFAAAAKVSSRTVRRWIVAGEIPGPIEALLDAWKTHALARIDYGNMVFIQGVRDPIRLRHDLAH